MYGADLHRELDLTVQDLYSIATDRQEFQFQEQVEIFLQQEQLLAILSREISAGHRDM